MEKKYVVAVSGGVDSVALLHMLAKRNHRLVVAHFDHGIRPNSAADARFVEGLAKQYKVPFVGKREELGPGASEELARKRRYAFLRGEALTLGAKVVTAHHADDSIETIAINIQRGTGWRGLAVLDSSDIIRPLLTMTKKDIYDYALRERLEWVEDETNGTSAYLRNRLRLQLAAMETKTKRALLALRDEQILISRQWQQALKQFLQPNATYERYLFINSDPRVATELLREAIARIHGRLPTRPQAERALLAVKTAKVGSIHHVGQGVKLRFTLSNFIVERS